MQREIPEIEFSLNLFQHLKPAASAYSFRNVFLSSSILSVPLLLMFVTFMKNTMLDTISIYFLFSPILMVEVDAMLSSEFKDPATDDDGRVGARTLFWITAQLEVAASFAFICKSLLFIWSADHVD